MTCPPSLKAHWPSACCYPAPVICLAQRHRCSVPPSETRDIVERRQSDQIRQCRRRAGCRRRSHRLERADRARLAVDKDPPHRCCRSQLRDTRCRLRGVSSAEPPPSHAPSPPRTMAVHHSASTDQPLLSSVWLTMIAFRNSTAGNSRTRPSAPRRRDRTQSPHRRRHRRRAQFRAAAGLGVAGWWKAGCRSGRH